MLKNKETVNCDKSTNYLRKILKIVIFNNQIRYIDILTVNKDFKKKIKPRPFFEIVNQIGLQVPIVRFIQDHTVY